MKGRKASNEKERERIGKERRGNQKGFRMRKGRERMWRLGRMAPLEKVQRYEGKLSEELGT